MRVALVTYGLNTGGMETFLLTLASGLREHGIRVEFFETEFVGPWHHRPAELDFFVGDGRAPFWMNRTAHARHLAEMLGKFDVVLINYSREAQAGVGLLEPTCAAVSVVHNTVESIVEAGSACWPDLDKIVCVSPAILEMAALHGVPREKLVCIVNGTPVPSSWPKASESVEKRPLRAVVLGRVHHGQKGVLDLPEIFAQAMKVGSQVTLDVVGAGDDLDRLRELMLQRCPSAHVQYHGALPHEKAMAILGVSDVLLMPSRHEGLPIVLLEAMARGVVPIVSRLPGVTDVVVTDGHDGILLGVGDTSGFANALVRLNDQAARMEMSRHAWETATARFSIARMCDEYVGLFNDVIEARRHSPTPRSGLINRRVLGRFISMPAIFRRIVVAAQHRFRRARARQAAAA